MQNLVNKITRTCAVFYKRRKNQFIFALSGDPAQPSIHLFAPRIQSIVRILDSKIDGILDDMKEKKSFLRNKT